MAPSSAALPQSLLRDLFRIDEPLLVARHKAALESIGLKAPERESFHVDAAGFSPELSADLGDPFYLGVGFLQAHAVIVAVEQLRAPLVHPSLGYAAGAFRKITAASTREISGITLREPLIGEVRHPTTHLATTQQLADLSGFEIHFRTPGGLVRGVRKLDAMKEEFLASDRRWLDDEFIEEMASLAGEVRDLGRLSEEFVASRHSLGPFYSPAFGGSYVVEEPGASSRTATTYILSAEPSPAPAGEEGERRSARGRRVVVRALEPATAVELLGQHRIGRLDLDALRRRPGVIDGLLHWIAVEHLLASDPLRPLSAGAHEVTRAMRKAGDPPPDYLELEDLRRRLRERRVRVDPASLSPLTQLRLLTPISRREPIRRFVRHIQTSVDPAHLERWWRHAPDVFFARLPALSPARRDYLARWLDANTER